MTEQPAELIDTRYATVTEWVTEQFNPIYRRTLGGEFRWCAEWWRHAEAIVRLSSLWYSWEEMRLQGATGIGLWFRDHLDHQLPILMGPRGPFYQCTERDHFEPHQARLAEPLDGWWDPDPLPVGPAITATMDDAELLRLLREFGEGGTGR
ncbi:uncharacterized protein DUF4913 [Actinocorallia herbida]|uniref:Uncharacterized protein DUF4913 n=1 Tax=Actinocorallia herbida TaxID=58109 RepID=A0A3N1D3M5_9ACTN|nr:DUF4913 domain-containing protein [Actinocorallia herbida]ROO88109.1 uncharacterized protein DUF4913 [Actinocorallia herbida]